MPYPEWLSPGEDHIRENCGLEPGQLFTTANDTPDEERLRQLIRGHIETQSAYVWAEARKATGGLSFPSSVEELAVAFPLLLPVSASVPLIASLVEAKAADNEQRVEEQRTLARLAITSLVYAKLWYACLGDEARQTATNHWITAQGQIKALRETLTSVRSLFTLHTELPFA